MDDWAELGRSLIALASSGTAEVREDGYWLADLASLHCEFRQEEQSPIIHLWSDGCNLTRRVLRAKENSESRVVLEVQRFGRAKPGRLEFLRTNAPRTPGRATREQFRARLRRILAEQFPDASVESLTASPDLEHSFSGLYVRGLMQEGARSWALIAVSPDENVVAIEGILAFGILWLDWTRSHPARRPVEGLRLLVPGGAGRRLRERALALSASVRAEIFEYGEPDGRMQKMDVADAGNLESWLVPRGDVESTFAAARDAFARISLLGAFAEGAPGAIAPRAVAGTTEVALCFRGLEFARWSRDGISFGLGDTRERLTGSTEPRLERLIRQLDLHRNPLAKQMNHRLYRAAPERWLESLVLEDPLSLEAQLDPRFLYSQVPALAAGDRGVIDLLGITRRGRLVVIELKASEDIQLPIQAVDYWLRVRRHQREGDFQQCGYFTGIEIDPHPPLVWLVAPGLRFHPATQLLAKYLSPEISIARIGLVENWRRGIKVIFRQ
jgi:hypothetical protein